MAMEMAMEMDTAKIIIASLTVLIVQRILV